MVFFWKPAAQLAMRMETMRKAEAGLIALSLQFGEGDPSKFTTELFDTQIPVSVLPFKEDSGTSFWSSNSSENGDDEEQLTMHAIRVSEKADDDGGLPSSSESRTESRSKSKYPLVIVHGYMNGALYFYRNLVGLASYFETVISVDLLGYGLSSRPSFDRLKDDSVETAEAFFVESLESWRSKNNIEKMTLAGHSMGGYLSVAYCEKYPDRVDQLLLLSPAGVPEETPESIERRSKFLSTTTRRLAYGFFSKLWEGGYTPGMVFRTIPESKGRYLVEGYVKKRLPAIQDPEERAILEEYMYTGCILPASGEYALGSLLSPPGSIARKPVLRRIPKLDVRKVSFLYGIQDWMDVQGGLGVQDICREEAKSGSGSSTPVPEINVYQVKDAGHLLMLDNAKGFNAALVVSAGFDPSSIADPTDLPIVATTQLPPSNQLDDTSRSKPNGTDGEEVQVTA